MMYGVTSYTKMKTIGDPHYSSVISLNNFAGEEGSIVIADKKPVTWAVSGGAKITKASAFPGGSSLSLPGEVSGYIYSPDMPNLASDKFTIDFWVLFKPGARPVSTQAIIGRWAPLSTPQEASYQLGFGSGGTDTPPTSVYFAYYDGTNTYRQPTQSISLQFDTYYFCEVNRDGSDIRFFIDGVQIALFTAQPPHRGGVRATRLGSSDDPTYNNTLRGQIDEIRVTNGVCRNKANYTRPAMPFPH